jgi:hypothetical protein
MPQMRFLSKKIWLSQVVTISCRLPSQISMPDVFAPLNDPGTPQFLVNVYFADHLHPAVLGHKMIASVIAFNLDLDGSLFAASDFEISHRKADKDFLPPPLAVLSTLASMYTGDSCYRLNLADPRAVKEAILPSSPNLGMDSAHAFSVFEDVVGKPGLIATSPGSVVHLGLSPPKRDPKRDSSRTQLNKPGSSAHDPKKWLVMVGYLTSYVGMGNFTAKVFHHCGLCATNSTAPQATSGGGSEEIAVAEANVDGFHLEKVSIYTTALLQTTEVSSCVDDLAPPKQNLELGSLEDRAGDDGGCLYLEVKVNPDPKRKQHKVKLYDVTWAETSL